MTDGMAPQGGPTRGPGPTSLAYVWAEYANHMGFNRLDKDIRFALEATFYAGAVGLISAQNAATRGKEREEARAALDALLKELAAFNERMRGRAAKASPTLRDVARAFGAEEA